MVDRYDMCGDVDSCDMKSSNGGEYVKYEDYEKLGEMVASLKISLEWSCEKFTELGYLGTARHLSKNLNLKEK